MLKVFATIALLFFLGSSFIVNNSGEYYSKFASIDQLTSTDITASTILSNSAELTSLTLDGKDVGHCLNPDSRLVVTIDPSKDGTDVGQLLNDIIASSFQKTITVELGCSMNWFWKTRLVVPPSTDLYVHSSSCVSLVGMPSSKVTLKATDEAEGYQSPTIVSLKKYASLILYKLCLVEEAKIELLSRSGYSMAMFNSFEPFSSLKLDNIRILGSSPVINVFGLHQSVEIYRSYFLPIHNATVIPVLIQNTGWSYITKQGVVAVSHLLTPDCGTEETLGPTVHTGLGFDTTTHDPHPQLRFEGPLSPGSLIYV